MWGFEQIRKNLRMAGLMLLLLVVAGMGSNASAQSVATPNPWPAPTTFPPAAAIVPATQTIPTGFDMTGMLQFASLDATPGICTPPSACRPQPRASTVQNNRWMA